MTHVRRFGALAALALVTLAGLVPRSARAEAELLARDAEGHERGIFPLARTEVRAEVSGRVISVDVTQRFQNPYRERIEAVYNFPLPTHAAVDDMEMRTGGRVIRAEVHRRQEARARYDEATTAGQRAALIEQERPNLFTVSVANIDPGGEIVVRLHYFELARYDHGTYELVVPMTVGPRYVPGQALPVGASGAGVRADTDRVPDGSRISPSYTPPGVRSGHTVGVSVQLYAGVDIATLDSPEHAVDVVRANASHAQVTLRDRDEIPNRDFVLRWTLAASEVQAAVFTHRPDAQTDGYLALLLEPRHDAPAGELAPREIFFLLDTSGSMQGPPLGAAAAAVRRALATLNPGDSFQIIDFADTASSFAPLPLPNTPANVAHALEYLARLTASGGTNQLAGIHAALTAPGDPMRLRYVVFMTDGFIGNESEVVGLVQREIGQARIFGFGIGGSVNRFLLDEVSYAGRGAAEYLLPGEGVEALVERFYQRIGRPYLTDITVDWGGLRVDRALPNPLPDLSTFEPLVVLGRYHEAGTGEVTVRGRVAGRPFERRLRVTLPAVETDGAALGRIWAREEITGLTRLMHFRGAEQGLVNDVTELALSHNLVSQYTSLVAVEQGAVDPAPGATGAPRRVNQPSEAPAAVNLAAAGGRPAPMPVVSPAHGMPMLSQQATQGQVTPTSSSAPAPPPIVPPIYGVNGEPSAPESPPRTAQTSPGSSGDVVTTQSMRRGGCASCTVGAGSSQGRVPALALMALGVALLAVRRSRRR